MSEQREQEEMIHVTFVASFLSPLFHSSDAGCDN